MKILSKFLAEESHMLKTKEEVLAWLKEYNKFGGASSVDSITISSNLVIDIRGGFRLSSRADIVRLPVKFGTIKGSFKLKYNGELISIEGCPNKVMGEFWCTDNHKLKSLKGAPKEVEGDVFISNNAFKDLHDIHKYLPMIKGEIYIDKGIESHVLGLLMIKGLKYINVISMTADTEDAIEDDTLGTHQKVFTILNRHLPASRENVFEAQEELIDAGYPDYAKL